MTQRSGTQGVLKASAVKVMSPPPNNFVVCLPVISKGKIIGQLQSEPLSEAQAQEMVQAINKDLARE